MASALLKISGAAVYDPAHGVDGQVRDLWISGSKIVAPPSDPAVRPARVIDARGLVVMAGGVDMHCHIVGPKVNTARALCPEQKRRGEPVRRTGITRSGKVLARVKAETTCNTERAYFLAVDFRAVRLRCILHYVNSAIACENY